MNSEPELLVKFQDELGQFGKANTNQNKEFMKLIQFCVSFPEVGNQNIFFQHTLQQNLIDKLFNQFENHKFPQLTEYETSSIIRNCNSLSALGQLYMKKELNLKSTNFQDKSPKLRQYQIRDKIRNIVDDQLDPEQIFYIKKLQHCKNQEEVSKYTILIKYAAYILIDFGQDSFNFSQLFDILIRAIFLSANIRTISNDQFFQLIIEKLSRFLINNPNLYYWTVIFETILYASKYVEKSKDLFQPTLIGRLILTKIPFISDIYEHIGLYLINTFSLTKQMFTELLKYGAHKQLLELIYLLCKDLIQINPKQAQLLQSDIMTKLSAAMDCQNIIEQQIDIFMLFLNNPTFSSSNSKQQQFWINQIINGVNQYWQDYSPIVRSKIQELFSQISKTNKTLNVSDFKHISRLILKQDEKAYSKIYEMNTSPRKLQLVGMKNLLNTCYLNSFIQALFMTQELRDWILSEPMDVNGNYFFDQRSLKGNLQNCFTYMSSMYTSVEFCPFQLKRSFRDPYKSEIGQQDAGEFGAHLFEDMEKEFSKEDYEKIKSLFVGVSQSEFICQKCRNRMKGPAEEFIQIALNFSSESTNYIYSTLSQMMAKQFSQETLQFNCEKCKVIGLSQRTVNYTKLPNNLCILLNRFQFKNGMKFKIKSNVQLESVIKLLENGREVQYKLYAFILHYGSTPDSGHYMTYALHENMWHLFDDSEVTDQGSELKFITSHFTQEQTPYILFYRKI